MIAVATGDKGAVMLSSEEKIRPIMACETLAPLGESGAAILGEMMTMPGLPRTPAAEMIMFNETGEIEGLF